MEHIKIEQEKEIIRIDGSIGEGGGQILRTSLALSVLLKKPFEIFNIRANRPNPGLQAQHLKAIEASAKISNAMVEGAFLKSSRVKFFPEGIFSGDYRFDIGTAGSTSLVLQTLYLPLSFADLPSNLVITGGTHVQWSPTFDYLKNCWLYFMERLGFKIKIEMRRAGFYPHGGGEIRARVDPINFVNFLKLEEVGKLLKIIVYSAHTNLSDEVAKRQAKAAEKILKNYAEIETIIDELPSLSKNTTIAITGIFENTICCYTNLGEKGKRAEKVAEEACMRFINFISSGATVDEYMSDQILLPLVIADGSSEFTVSKLTNHLMTNIDTIRKFIDARIEIIEQGKKFKIKVHPVDAISKSKNS